MDTHTSHETFDVFVSESALLNGYFGVYGISSDQPDLQMYLSGGFENVDDAIEAAHTLIHRSRSGGIPIPVPEDYVVEYRKREDFKLEERYPLLEKDDLVESVATHIKQWFVTLNKKTLLKTVLSYGNLMVFGTGLVIWIYWTNRSFTDLILTCRLVAKACPGKC